MHDTHPQSTEDLTLPPRPEMPDPAECCGGGCSPCILDVYDEALQQWKRKVAEIELRRQAVTPECLPTADDRERGS